MNDDYPIINVQGTKYPLDYSDLNGLEWQEVKKLTGLTPIRAINECASMDFEVIGAIAWIIIRRDTDMTYEEVLESLSIKSFVDEVDGDDIPKDSEENG
jgi:hypothetical protein